MADYISGFGITGCDLSKNLWWAAYARQSTREQTENDRLLEYLITLAKMAKQREVIVPYEYIIYDARSSEDLNRPGIIWLRKELVYHRKISGVIIPLQGRLSADPLHQMTIEKECEYYGVQLVFNDAPTGNDWASQTARLIQAQANSLRVKSNRDNVLAGNIARVVTDKVPPQRAPFSYTLVVDKVINQRTGRIKVNSASWQVEKVDETGKLITNSPAWIVHQIFIWIGEQGRTCYWVANELNKMEISPPQH